MASVFKPTYLRPIPVVAKPCTVNGQAGVVFTDKRGRQHKRLVRTGKDGQKMMVCEQSHWWLRFTLPDGTENRRKGYTDKAASEQEAHRLEREAEQRAAGLIPVDRDHLLAPITKHLDDFVESRRVRGRSDKYYDLLHARILRTITECGWITLTSVTPESFTRFLFGTVVREHPKGKTPVHFHGAATAFMNWCVKNRRLLANPLVSVERPQTGEPTYVRGALSLDQARLLLQVSGPRAIVYLTAMRTGLRRKELRQLLWLHVHVGVEDAIPHLTLPKTITKNRQEATIRLTSELAEELREYRPANAAPLDRVFCSVPKMNKYRQDLKAAGIPEWDEHGHKVDFHCLRVTLCTQLLAANAPVAATMSVMRHADPRLTMKTYADTTKLGIGAVVDSLPLLLDSDEKKPAEPTGTTLKFRVPSAPGCRAEEAVS